MTENWGLLHIPCLENGDNTAREVKSWLSPTMPQTVLHSLKQDHLMVLWHFMVHDVSPSYNLQHLRTVLEGGGVTVGYQPNNCGARARVRHLTSSCPMRLMTHSDGLLPRNTRLWLSVQWMQRNSHETCIRHMYIVGGLKTILTFLCWL